MSILSKYISRNINKYLISESNNFVYIFSHYTLKTSLAFKVCLNSGKCNFVTRNNVYNFDLSIDDLDQLRALI